jgi:hypothetical protein
VALTDWKKLVKIANETCLGTNGRERSVIRAPDIEIGSHLRGTNLGGCAHRHPLTRITEDQAMSGIGQ